MLARLTEFPLLVILLGVTAMMSFLPAAHALAMRQHQVAQGFFYSGLILLILAVMVGIATRSYLPRNAARAQLAALVSAYLLLPVAMALPLLQVVPDTTFVNAWFEMLSAFTTTGASVYEAARLPPSLHLWRALVGWFGGFLILLSAYAILAPLNLGGVEVISGRVPGRGVTGTNQITRVADPSARIARYALSLFPVYTGLTLILWVGLLLSGTPSLSALCLAMGTLSTSGIAMEGVAKPPGLLAEILMFLFLFLAVSRRIMPGSGFVDHSTPVWRDPELRLVVILVLLVPAILFLRHFFSLLTGTVPGEVAGFDALWGALFTTLSFLTTTGYHSVHWTASQDGMTMSHSGLVLLALALVGGGVATTAGGLKLLRVYAIFRHGEREMQRIIHPRSVGGRGKQARTLRREGAYMAWIFFMLFALSIAVVMAALTLVGLEFEPALVLALAALTTTGPLADVAISPPLSYAALGTPAKIVTAAAMIVGRLETLALLALIAPTNWRK